jgi:Na+-driven multidrug efflux pump
MTGRLWLIRIPLIVLSKNFTNLGYNGIWYSMVLSNLLTVLVGYAIYKSGKWETKVIKREEKIIEGVS